MSITLYGLDRRPGGRLILAPSSAELLAGLTDTNLTTEPADAAVLAAFIWAQQAAWTLWASQQPVDTARPSTPADYRSTAARSLPPVAVRLLRAPKDRTAVMPSELTWMPDWPVCFVTPWMLAPGEKAPAGTVSMPITPMCALRALVKSGAIETGTL